MRNDSRGASIKVATRGFRGRFSHRKQRRSSLLFASASRCVLTMREIVHLQAGQCGNQIGSKVRPRQATATHTHTHTLSLSLSLSLSSGR